MPSCSSQLRRGRAGIRLHHPYTSSAAGGCQAAGAEKVTSTPARRRGGQARAGLACWRQLLWYVDVEDVLPDLGQDLRVAATGCPLVQQHLGLDDGALAGNLASGCELVELPAEVVASPPSDE